MGESAAYSTKGHFKSADGRRALVRWLIITTIVTSAAALLGDLIPEKFQRGINALALASSIALLYFQTKSDADYVTESMQAGNKYLTLHNDIRDAYEDGINDRDQITALRKRLSDLNESKRPNIGSYAKRRAKRSIEKKGEMTAWWKDVR